MVSLDHFLELLQELFREGSTVWLILFGAATLVVLIFFLRGIYIHVKRSVESLNYIVLAIFIFIWLFSVLSGPLFGIAADDGTWTQTTMRAASYLIPTLLMFHIWSQVSYRPIKAGTRIGWLIVPVLLIFLLVVENNHIIIVSLVAMNNEPVSMSLIEMAANVYFVVVVIKSYLLCFNVFYQMPKHMRRSTYQMLLAISVMIIAHVAAAYFSVSDNMSHIIMLIAYISMMSVLYEAFFIANSANVIVTSREFVFSSLSTMVITVSLKGNILDWNHKEAGSCYPLPAPKYKEPYPEYRKRIIDTCNGAVSPHDENILNIKADDGEVYFLFTWHEIGYLGRKFGYLVEISDVTESYSKLRYFEEIALYDNLTGMYNRNAYINKVKEIVAEENIPLLITVGDANNLKKINDVHGHIYGDKLLLTISNVVKEHAPAEAFVARIGGDEIVMLLPNADERDAISFIAAVTEALNAIHEPEIGTPSISWGYSVMYDANENYNDVFRAADAIMYEAKRRAHEISISGIVPQ